MTEPIELDLVAGTGEVTLNLASEDVTLDLATEPAIGLDLSGGESVALDYVVETEEVTISFTDETVVLALSDQSVTIASASPETITLETGPATGPQGPPGPPGVGSSFVHNQATPAVLWSIAHDVPYRPNVTVVDTAGTVLIANVTYPDDTTVHVAHDYAIAGYAYLS